MLDDKSIDKIFQGVLEDLPRPTSKVALSTRCCIDISLLGCAYFYKLDLHRHDDGEEHSDAVCVSKTQSILQRETWPGVPGTDGEKL